jgi:hypothetical protein
MNMKKYIKPAVTETIVELMPLMNNSVTSVTGDANDINTSEDEFTGGSADGRRHTVWDDMDEEEDY